MTRSARHPAGLLLVVTIGVVAAGLSYLSQRLLCALAATIPALRDICDFNPHVLAAGIGGVVTALSLVGWWLRGAR